MPVTTRMSTMPDRLGRPQLPVKRLDRFASGPGANRSSFLFASSDLQLGPVTGAKPRVGLRFRRADRDSG